MSALEVGQVISLRIRFNNSGTISKSPHPYLVVDIRQDLGAIEIAQLDSLAGKEHKAAFRSNKVVFCTNPNETVIDKDSYIQLDNIILVEDYPELVKFRRQPDKLSQTKLDVVLRAYHQYHSNNTIDENKIVYMDQAEIQQLNP